MTRRAMAIVTSIAGLLLTLVPLSADAFSLTGSNFRGFVAYHRGGDVVGTYNLDPRLNFENTGEYFNFAAGMSFDITYNPSDPSFEEVFGNPDTPYLWTLSVDNLGLPFAGGLNFDVSHVATANQIRSGFGWLQDHLSTQFEDDMHFLFDAAITGPNTGTASLILAGNINSSCIPRWMPRKFILPWQIGGSITLSANNIPQHEAPIPEPATMLLFGLGAAGVGTFRAFRNRP